MLIIPQIYEKCNGNFKQNLQLVFMQNDKKNIFDFLEHTNFDTKSKGVCKNEQCNDKRM